ncbi:hypothetical protein DITRI_Ditri02bG0125300 [Diplodiscus trichospermus]
MVNAEQNKVNKKENIVEIRTVPEEGWLNINSDGAFDQKEGNEGSGLIIRDHYGFVIDGFGREVLANSTIIIEALAF